MRPNSACLYLLASTLSYIPSASNLLAYEPPPTDFPFLLSSPAPDPGNDGKPGSTANVLLNRNALTAQPFAVTYYDKSNPKYALSSNYLCCVPGVKNTNTGDLGCGFNLTKQGDDPNKGHYFVAVDSKQSGQIVSTGEPFVFSELATYSLSLSYNCYNYLGDTQRISALRHCQEIT